MQLPTDNKVCWIELFNHKLLLSERTARDVNRLSEYAKKADKTFTDAVLQNLQVVCDGLKINVELLKWWQVIRRIKLKRLISRKRLHAKLSVNSIVLLAQKVLALEGIDLKKKSSSDQE